MIRLFPAHTNRNQFSLKQILLAFIICASIATWIGISTIWADEVDPGDYEENTETDFQNAAQEQHANNIAKQAALQDEAVTAAIESGDNEAARIEFEKAFDAYMQEISEKRAEGEGWGNIVKDLGVHPGWLGLGHFKNEEGFAGKSKEGFAVQNNNSQTIHGGLALGHSKDKGAGNGIGHAGGNGHGGGRGGGKK